MPYISAIQDRVIPSVGSASVLSRTKCHYALAIGDRGCREAHIVCERERPRGTWISA